MSSKKTFKIYQLLNDSIDKTEKDTKKLIDTLVNKVNKKILNDWWNTNFQRPNEAKIVKKIFKLYSLEIVLYKAKHSIKNMHSNFFEKDLLWQANFEKVEDIFICFVIIDWYIYFFSSSHTFAYFLNYVNEDFPIKIGTKLITWKVKYEKSISITWETLTSDLIFRWLKWFSKFDILWKVIKGFIWEIDPSKSKKIIDLIIPKWKKYFCEVWNSFTLRKSLDFNDTIRLIQDLHILFLEKENNEDYNDFQLLEKIKPRFEKNKNLIWNLNKKIAEDIFKFYEDTSSEILNNYELIPPRDFIDFIECTSFSIQYNWDSKNIDWLLNIKDIIKIIKEENPNIKTAESIYKIFEENLSIYWYNPDWEQKLNSPKRDLTKYIVNEFEHDNKKFFCINWEFYQVKEEFIKILDSDLIKELEDENLYLKDNIEKNIIEWDFNLITSEWKYNEEYLGKSNFIVLDRVLYKNIEFCDLLFSENWESFLFHNKQWFDWDMRILSEQVSLSALTLSENRKQWNKQILIDYYNSLENKISTPKMAEIWKQAEKYKQNDFYKLLDNNSNLNFVLAFTYNSDLLSVFKSKDKKKIQNKLNKLSIIAKYELLVLIKKMRTIWINFFITQIKTK